MPAIITNAFRTYNADNFIASFTTNKMYLMIGKKTEWSGTDLGQYTGTATDLAVPTPIDTTVAPYIHHNDMIAAKLINASDVSHVIKRNNWTSGVVYNEYDHEQNDLIDLTYFVMTDEYNVYKCISNNDGSQSTSKPTGQQAVINELPDGYRWKFMYEVAQVDVLKFVTSDWIPVKTLIAADSSPQWTVQDSAVDGSLEHIDITDGGTNYVQHAGTSTSGTTTTIVLENTALQTDDYYNDMTIKIIAGTGIGQSAVISDYDGTAREATIPTWTQTDATSQYTIFPTVVVTPGAGDTPSINAVASVGQINSNTGAIEKIVVETVGGGYRSATVAVSGGVTGAGAIFSARIGPPGGHGSDAKRELGGVFVMMNIRLQGTEGGDFLVGDDFRKVILIANPNADGVAATAGTYSGETTPNELDEDSGNMIYIEYRAPINRASDQTEDVKLVVEF